jgi:hypothetical protein
MSGLAAGFLIDGAERCGTCGVLTITDARLVEVSLMPYVAPEYGVHPLYREGEQPPAEPQERRRYRVCPECGARLPEDE